METKKVNKNDSLYKTPTAVIYQGSDGRYYICQLGKAGKEEYRPFTPESPVMPFKYKKDISYSANENKPLRNDSGAKSANPYPQDAENDEYRYIDAGWLEKVAQGLTAGARKHLGETWRQIPPEEHAARAMRHLNLNHVPK